MAEKKLPTHINIKNRRAEFDYLVVDRLTAGIVLSGSEIKSIREGRAGLSDTYCYFHQGELWVKNIYIAPYALTSWGAAAERRDRKLLLCRSELRRLQTDAQNPGYTVVPLRLFINDHGLAKLEIGLCRGKKQYDKRATLREKDDRREMDRIMKNKI